MSSTEVPTGEVVDNDYKSRTGQSEIPVQSDEAPVEDPINPDTADSDQQLGTLRTVCLSSIDHLLTIYHRNRREAGH